MYFVKGMKYCRIFQCHVLISICERDDYRKLIIVMYTYINVNFTCCHDICRMDAVPKVHIRSSVDTLKVRQI